MDNVLNTLVKQEFEEVQKKYTGMTITSSAEGCYSLNGQLSFSAVYECETIKDEFKIEIFLDKKYPQVLPVTKETGGRIPSYFHTNDGGVLCLGTLFQIKKTFNNNPCLLGYIESILIPYLASFSYWEINGKMLCGECEHGARGILDSYKEHFSVDSDIVVLKILKLSAEDLYKGHFDCPCGSGLRLRNCHGGMMIAARTYFSQIDFINDYLSCLDFLKRAGIRQLPSDSQKIKDTIRKYCKKNKIKK